MATTTTLPDVVNADALTAQAVRYNERDEALEAVPLHQHRASLVKPVRLYSPTRDTTAWALAAAPIGHLADGPLHLLTEDGLWATVCGVTGCTEDPDRGSCPGHPLDAAASVEFQWELYGAASGAPQHTAGGAHREAPARRTRITLDIDVPTGYGDDDRVIREIINVIDINTTLAAFRVD